MNERQFEALETIGRRNHSITNEYRIFGPPGTGKTTSVAQLVRRAVDRLGPECSLVTSFTRTAAAEIGGHDLSISSGRVGTLHSHCYRALGGPAIGEGNVTD
jgi:superfamily I DNA/RNA helicase